MFGVSQKGARKWLEAESIPDTKRIPQMAARLGVSAEWLLTGREPLNPAATLPGPKLSPRQTLTGLLADLAARLDQADPALRGEVSRLVLRYLDHPEARARLVGAIAQLLDGHDDPTA